MIIASLVSALGLIFGVVMIFNVMIFIHELGHFWAARWRGLKVDRFQIWFGKPLWSKEINGVQWGLGWLPMGGFVSLPQMAPMESIEGKAESEDGEPLPDITPLDKIIVAFAGPLFSFLLAFLAAVMVWKVGKPADVIPTTEIGYVERGGPAEKAGVLVGDEILEVNGREVTQFRGDLDSIAEQIMLSEKEEITFLVKREGEEAPLTLVSKFVIPETKTIMPNSPAEKAELMPGDRILAVDGQKMIYEEDLSDYIKAKGKDSLVLRIEREGEEKEISVAAASPKKPKDHRPLIGFSFGFAPYLDQSTVYPSPVKQIKDSGLMMWTTLQKVFSPKSKVGAEHLSGPIGIGKTMFLIAQTDVPWQRLMAFAVLLNVNLAILNMLPLPVLDGGHITMALYEMVTRRILEMKSVGQRKLRLNFSRGA